MPRPGEASFLGFLSSYINRSFFVFLRKTGQDLVPIFFSAGGTGVLSYSKVCSQFKAVRFIMDLCAVVYHVFSYKAAAMQQIVEAYARILINTLHYFI